MMVAIGIVSILIVLGALLWALCQPLPARSGAEVIGAEPSDDYEAPEMMAFYKPLANPASGSRNGR